MHPFKYFRFFLRTTLFMSNNFAFPNIQNDIEITLQFINMGIIIHINYYLYFQLLK